MSSAEVAEGSDVGIEYTLKLDDGTVADSNVDGDPLVYTQGNGQIIPALEQALEGLSVGDSTTVSIAAGDAYGSVDPAAFQNVPIENVPEELRREGAAVVASMQDGSQRQVRVHEVHPQHVVIDFNHPLAGRDLTFDVKILSVA
jgi:FKBP-type peptidyl-prolyl cis-trans isomerase 2